MAFDDLMLDRPAHPKPSAPKPQSGPTRWVVLGAAAIVAIALLALWWMSRNQPDAAVPAPTPTTDAGARSNRPKRQEIDLPALDQSDDTLRHYVALLSKHPLLARLLATQGLVRGATLAVVQIGDGRTPAVPFAVLQPSAHASIIGTTTGHVDPLSYKRWDAHTAALTSIDTAQLAQLYVNVKPLFDQAYHELGHPDSDFDEAIVRAIQTLNETPNVADDPVLRQGHVYLEHEDASLQALPPVQKQFLLMGPDNRKRILAWLKQLASNLDLKLD